MKAPTDTICHYPPLLATSNCLEMIKKSTDADCAVTDAHFLHMKEKKLDGSGGPTCRRAAMPVVQVPVVEVGRKRAVDKTPRTIAAPFGQGQGPRPKKVEKVRSPPISRVLS